MELCNEDVLSNIPIDSFLMKFKVISPARRVPLERHETFVLMQDNWNDHGYRTQFITCFLVDSKQSTRIGTVKILRRGQTIQDGIQITEDFDTLGDKYVSVGQELDYYHRLTELGSERRRAILLALNDVVAIPELRKRFEKEEGVGDFTFQRPKCRNHRQFPPACRSGGRG